MRLMVTHFLQYVLMCIYTILAKSKSLILSITFKIFNKVWHELFRNLHQTRAFVNTNI